ncbi:hypothetical protein QQF64_019420 [Cirrhinus molitorella]|uniref:Secreted protein n=1 Tax=Cirrhinus molitorella TaxID=172907 RepID=A0ABR3LIR5_9TELE
MSAVALVVLASAMYILYRKRKRVKPKRNGFEPCVNTEETVQTEDEEVQYAETGFCRQNKQKEKANGTEEIIYSRIVKRH